MTAMNSDFPVTAKKSRVTDTITFNKLKIFISQLTETDSDSSEHADWFTSEETKYHNVSSLNNFLMLKK